MSPNLTRWTEQHALLMTMSIGAVLLEKSPLPVVAMAAGSFLGLIWRSRRNWTPAQVFGLANGITLARLLTAMTVLLAVGGNTSLTAALLFGAVCADGLDGWAARRYNTASAFGHLFDQETDAFLLLAVCLLLFISGKLGAFILLPGALRYLFVLFGQVAKPPERNVRGNRFTRATGVTAVLTFTLCLLPLPPALDFWLAVAVTLALGFSFAYSTWQLYRPAPGLTSS
jgi:phosphatidylglycerophosphate synthase